MAEQPRPPSWDDDRKPPLWRALFVCWWGGCAKYWDDDGVAEFEFCKHCGLFPTRERPMGKKP